MSKTAGTAVTLAEAIDRHGADALRYFLLREVGFDNDGDFTWERFDARYTSELADTVGNLVSRALTMIVNYRGGTVPRDPKNYDTPLEAAARGALATYARAMDAHRLQEGAAQAVALASAANRYIEETAPYKLAKKPGKTAEPDSVLADLARTLARIAVLVQPFLPPTPGAVWGAAQPRRAAEPPHPLHRGDAPQQAREPPGKARRARLGAREPGPHRGPDRRPGAAVPPRHRRDRVGHGGVTPPRPPGPRPAGGPGYPGSGRAAGPEAPDPVPQASAGPRLGP